MIVCPTYAVHYHLLLDVTYMLVLVASHTKRRCSKIPSMVQT